MKLNKLRCKTTNGFKVNNLAIDLDLKELNTDKEYVVNGIEVTQSIKEDTITSNIGLTYSKYLELTISVDKVYDKPILVNYNFSNNDYLVSKVKLYHYIWQTRRRMFLWQQRRIPTPEHRRRKTWKPPLPENRRRETSIPISRPKPKRTALSRSRPCS